MRRVRDRNLPEPFRTWIDRSLPLPSGVTVLPRTINVSLEVFAMIYPGLAFVGMGIAFIAIVVSSQGWASAGGLTFLSLSSLILFGVPLWMACRLRRTVQASRDRKAGTLRQGVLVGREGLLVRLTPNRCYVVPLDRFVKATEWSGGGDEGTDWLKIETRDGAFDLAADELTVGATGVNEAVKAVKKRA